MSKKQLISTHIDELRKAMGNALWQIQGVEQMIAKYDALAFRIRPPATLQIIETEFEFGFKQTVGRLIGTLKTRTPPANIEIERLELFVEERNWLVHKLVRDVGGSLANTNTVNKAKARIKALEAEATSLIGVFHNMIVEHFVNHGVPLEFIKAGLEEEQREMHDD